MQAVSQALSEVKDLFQEITGKPAPRLEPQSFIAFPPGVDPVEQAIAEVEFLKQQAKQIAVSPTPVTWVPLADSFVTEDAFIIRIEVPGVPREELKVFVTGRECVVRGKRKQLEAEGATRPLSVERPWGAFERRFVLPAGSNSDSVAARYQDGVLELRIAIDEGVAPKETAIEVV